LQSARLVAAVAELGALDRIGLIPPMTPQDVAEQFVRAINAHNVERLAYLMTSDHRFIDSLGDVVEGRDAIREGWKAYFAMVPTRLSCSGPNPVGM
jgi:thioester reductase-like protein